jgi:hypothetical protein
VFRRPGALGARTAAAGGERRGVNTGAHVRPRRWRAWPPAARTLAALVATRGLTLLTAACGGSHSSSSGGGSTYDQARAFAECVRTHGVPLWPRPESSGRFDKSKLTPHQLGVGSSQIAAAERACKTLLPTYSATTQQSHVVAQALRFSRCMRAHGATNFPDPRSNGDRNPAHHGELAGVPGRAQLLRAQVRGAATTQLRYEPPR